MEVEQKDNGFLLQWNPPTRYSNYIVEVCELDADGHAGAWKKCAKVDDCSVTINDLPNASYRFRVSAQNKQGVSEPVENNEWLTLKNGQFNFNKFISKLNYINLN